MTKIIPAIDIIDNQSVRLEQGDFNRKNIYSNDPVQIAKQFELNGASRLHVVDLDAAKNGYSKNFKTIKAIVENTNLKVDVGGGIKDIYNIQILFDIGVSAVNIGTIAINNPEVFQKWLVKFGGNKVWLSLDIKDNKVATNGWQSTVDVSINNLLDSLIISGLSTVVVTSVARDGMLNGVDIELYKLLSFTYPNINFVASGGASTVNDIELLNKINIESVIVGKALYENNSSLLNYL